MFGPYWCVVLDDDLLQRPHRRSCSGSSKFRTTPILLFVRRMVVNVGMWFERFVIIVTSLHRDFLPSSWGMYHPTMWDFMTFIGTIGLFLTLFFLFIRFLPMISIFEMRTMAPAAKLTESPTGSEAH